MTIRFCLLLSMFFFAFISVLNAQHLLNADLLLAHANRFTIDKNNNLSDSTRILWQNLVGDNRLVGIAEKHHSEELSRFTAALLPILNAKDFTTFALELGPNSAELLNELASDTLLLSESIRHLNRKYGAKSASKSPLVFVNRKSNALFMNRAQNLDFVFWGLDQEFVHSYTMLLDRIDAVASVPDDSGLFGEAREAVQKNLFKSKVKGEPVYCWYTQNESINAYLNVAATNPEARQMIKDMRVSWDIYCKEASGVYASQQRADYMKSNFDSCFADQQPKKVLLKMGNVHLTHDISPFGVNDLGKHITEKSEAEGLGFLNIRFLNPYLNGKYGGNKTALDMFYAIGLKNQWTIVDLRAIRKLIENNELKTQDPYLYEIMNYDLLLLAPDDRYDNENNY